jgi:hypothetical protein
LSPVFFRQGVDDFARTRQPHLLARKFLNRLGIGFHGLDVLLELLIFLLELLDFVVQ